ncbi:MAG TPA: MarR family transcriptional regulator [Chloroflexota bacterium]|nr:MarR family transcriptional regulator [Chloroflexota bacterium]
METVKDAETAARESVSLIEHEVTLLIRRAEAARKEREAEVLDRSAYLLLGELERSGPLGIAALGQAFQVDISTASRQIAGLESKGLVTRRPDPADGRISLLRITRLGREQYQATRAARLALFDTLLAGWPLEDRREFAAYLARLNHAIRRRAARPGAPATE